MLPGPHQNAAVVPPRVIYIHNRVLSCVETAGMGSSAGHESSSQCKTIKTEARINKQSGFGHVILLICSLLRSCLLSSMIHYIKKLKAVEVKDYWHDLKELEKMKQRQKKH